MGNIGTSDMMNYTIIGNFVSKVKRLQENVKVDQILINQETYHMVQEYVQVRSVGDIQRKGQDKSEPIYEIIDVK